MNSRAIVHRHPSGSYWAEVPSLPGCVTFGRTRDEVLENIYQSVHDAVLAYRTDGREVPWQPEAAAVPTDADVHEMRPFWDEPWPPLDLEAIEEAHKEYERGEYVTPEEMIREIQGSDPPEAQS